MEAEEHVERTAHERVGELESFLAHQYPRVVGSVALITGDRASAEDAVQEALVKAWRRRDEPLDRIGAWITVVASNEARSRGRKRAAETRALERAASGARSDAPAPTVVDDELEQALARLPLRERQTAVLHYSLDMSVVDVAACLGVTEGTVKTLLSRARAHLAAELDPASADGGVA